MRITNIRKVKPKTVFAIETSSKTFIADGLAHHNCNSCNTYRGGEKEKYALFLEKEYGMGILQKLNKENKPKIWNKGELKKIIGKYKKIVDIIG